ncbi:MAG: DUF4126 domain-containing protein [Thermoanaerobaculia bacterium]
MSSDVSLPLVGLLLGASAASGLRLYATIAVLGFLGRSGALALPPGLQVLTNQWVILVAASLYLVEFLADKIPLVDSTWDLVHTFIRAPAAALLAWAALSTVAEEWRVVAALVCGVVALSAHGLKSSTRAVINTSPEPVTNWAASLAEDGLTAFLLFLAVQYPLAAALAAAAIVVLAAALGTWMWRALRRFRGSRRLHRDGAGLPSSAPSDRALF